ncbi:MAG: CHAT domain-containing tetratricopeptide repeat protein [Bacteroidales bacterium]
MIKNFILVLSILLFQTKLYSQNETWESLNKQEIQLNYQGEYGKAIEITTKALALAEKEYGKNHNNYALSLKKLAILYEKTKDYGKSENAWEQLIDLEKGKNPLDKDKLLYFYKRLSAIYYLEKKYDKEKPLDLEIVEIEKTRYDKSNTDYTTALSNLAYVYVNTGNYTLAAAVYKQALEVYREIRGHKNKDYQSFLENVAALFYKADYYDLALPFYTLIAENKKETAGSESDEYALALYDLASIYYTLSEYEMAISMYEKALEIDRINFGEDSPQYAVSLGSTAFVYKKTANYFKAEKLYLNAIDILKKNKEKYSVDYARSLKELASLYVIINRLGVAEALLTEAIGILKGQQGNNVSDYANTLNEMAVLYQKNGNYEKAEKLYLESSLVFKDYYSENSQAYAQSMNNLGSIYEAKDDYTKAEEFYRKALSIKKTINGSENVDYIMSADNLASLYTLTGRFEKADSILSKTSAFYKKSLGEWHPDYAISILKQADLYLLQKKYQKAELLYIQAISIFKKVYGTEHPDYNNALAILASFYETTGKMNLAEPLFKEASSNLNLQISRNFNFMNENEKELFLKMADYNFNIYHSFALRYNRQKPDIAGFEYNNELAHKGIILNSSLKLQHQIENSGNQDVMDLYRELLNTRKIIAQQKTITIDKRTVNTDSLENISDDFEKKIISELKKTGISEPVIGKSLTWKDIQKHLEPGEAAIEYISFYYRELNRWTDSIYYCALVLRPGDKSPKLVYLCEERQLVDCIFFTTENPSSIDNFYALNGTVAGEEKKDYYIYKLIWKPLEELLKSTKTVFVAPSGLLHRLSFNAIASPSGKYLSELFNINRVSSTALLISRSDHLKTGLNGKVMIYGGIDYNTSPDKMKLQAEKYLVPGGSVNLPQSVLSSEVSKRGYNWSYLPGTKEEASGIAEILSNSGADVTFLQGQDASEESFKSLNGKNSPEIVHVATHGFFFPEMDEKSEFEQQPFQVQFMVSENPLVRSGLLFSGGNAVWKNKNLPQGVDDGILTALEISDMYLPATKLVVLSACETGLGDIRGSEGVFGLQRAFKMAGVNYLVISLWQVPDEQTSELMQEFYKLMLSGNSVREAFFKSQNKLMEKYRENPYLWAAFILIQ